MMYLLLLLTISLVLNCVLASDLSSQKQLKRLLKIAKTNCKNGTDPTASVCFQSILSNHAWMGWDLNQVALEFCDVLGLSSNPADYFRALLQAGANPNARFDDVGYVVGPGLKIVKRSLTKADDNPPAGVTVYRKSLLYAAMWHDDYQYLHLHRSRQLRAENKPEWLTPVLLKAGADVHDPFAIFESITTNRYNLNWFKEHPEFIHYYTSEPMFAVQLVSTERRGDEFVEKYVEHDGKFDIELPDGSNLLFHATPTLLKEYLLELPEMWPLIQQKDGMGRSLLHEIVSKSADPELIDMLINKYQLNPNDLDFRGNTAVMSCVLEAGINPESIVAVVRALLPYSRPVVNHVGLGLLELVEADSRLQACTEAVRGWKQSWDMGTFRFPDSC